MHRENAPRSLDEDADAAGIELCAGAAAAAAAAAAAPWRRADVAERRKGCMVAAATRLQQMVVDDCPLHALSLSLFLESV